MDRASPAPPLTPVLPMRRLAFIAALLAAVFLGSIVLSSPPARLATPSSPVATWRDGHTAHIELAPDDRWRIAVTPDEVDPAFITALLAFEDKRFWHHPGVDPIAITRAAQTNLARGRIVSGASTITMQVVRVLEPRPRTLTSKLIETHRALALEARHTKAEILAAYLTFAPYGGNVEGVEAASWALFGHGAGHLSPSEIATLLAIPQNPTARVPRPDHTEALTAARREVARRLLDEAALPPGTTLREIEAVPVPSHVRPFPRHAPHAIGWLRQAAAAPHRLPTTLDAGLQRTAEQILSRYRDQRAREGIAHATILVVDHHSAELRAIVGNTGWLDGDGTAYAAFTVPRSPGSTLKPWLYAQGIDRGLLLPEQRIPDVPIRYGSYAPKNYDGHYDGLVRWEDALSRSLNVPFVNLLADVGVDPFLGTLRTAGVQSLDPTPDHYGLSAIVGGIELTPLEIAGLFATLAEGGIYRPLVARADLPHGGEGLRVISEGATWLTTRALQRRDRPDFPARANVAQLSGRIAWKTGTSFGHRDAWAVGYDQDHTALVWMGNLDQSPSRHLVGSEAAGEVLFDVLLAVSDRAHDPAPPPRELVPVEVCSFSGHLPGPACPTRQRVQAVEHAVAITPCPYHQAIEVDDATGLAVRPGCREGRTTRAQHVVRWPAAVRRWLEDRRHPLPEHPAWAPGCTPPQDAELRIVSPAHGEVVILAQGLPATDQEIPLSAIASEAAAKLAWFVDGRFLGRHPADARVWWTPTVGSHDVVVVGPSGHADRRTIDVIESKGR